MTGLYLIAKMTQRERRQLYTWRRQRFLSSSKSVEGDRVWTAVEKVRKICSECDICMLAGREMVKRKSPADSTARGNV